MDSKVVWVPLAEYAGLEGRVDEAQGTAVDSVVRGRLMVGDVDRDVAVKDNSSSPSSSLESSVQGSTAAADAIDEEADAAAAIDEVASASATK